MRKLQHLPNNFFLKKAYLPEIQDIIYHKVLQKSLIMMLKTHQKKFTTCHTEKFMTPIKQAISVGL